MATELPAHTYGLMVGRAEGEGGIQHALTVCAELTGEEGKL